MKQQAVNLNKKLFDIIQKDFEGCEWFIVAANELMITLHDAIEMFKDEGTPFETIKDSIGKIGVGIGNVERCLDAVEDCYNRTVELLSRELQKRKDASSN